VANDRLGLDAVLKLADKALQEFQGLLSITDRAGVVKKLRSLADLFERMPLLENDITTLRARLRGMMSSDPDRTPVTGISAEMAAIREARRTTTPGGIAIPLPVLPVKKIPREDPK
jgi:hypothetical protein